MPVMRSFGSFAGTPNLGANFTSGYKTRDDTFQSEEQARLAREKMSSEAAMAANQLAAQSAIQQQKLQQEAVQNQMEMQAKEKMFQQETMRKGQEMAMEDAYRNQVMQLKKGELEQQQKVDQIKIQEAIRQQAAMEKFKKDKFGYEQREELDPESAFKRAALDNPEIGFSSAASARAVYGNGGVGGGQAGFSVPEGGVDGVPIYNDKKEIIGYQVQTGRNNSRVIPNPKEITLPESMSKTHSVAGNKVFRNVDSPEVDRTEAQLKVAQKSLDEMALWGDRMVSKAKEKGAPQSTKDMADKYKAAKSEVEMLKSKLTRLTGDEEPASTPAATEDKLPEGKRGFSRKLGKPVIVKDGKWVIDQ